MLYSTLRIAFVVFLLANAFACRTQPEKQHPYLFLNKGGEDSKGTIERLVSPAKDVHTQKVVKHILSQAEYNAGIAPYHPGSYYPGRKEVHIANNNVNAGLVGHIGRRLLNGSLAYKMTGNETYKNDVLQQIVTLYDTISFPSWKDKAHGQFPADIRTGAITKNVGLAYDWLYHEMTPDERAMVRTGLIKRGIEPIWITAHSNPNWMTVKTNWFSNIVGGLGIAAMALGNKLDKQEDILAFCVNEFNGFMDGFGENGEFNESPGYSGSLIYPIEFYEAYRCYTNGQSNMLSQFPFPQLGEWIMHMTLPPGRLAAFGDTKTEKTPSVTLIAALASANQSPEFQWFYEQYRHTEPSLFEWLWYDPTLEAKQPGVEWNCKTYTDQGGCFVNRTEWNASHCTSVVYGKYRREDNHDDNDIGQVCMDAYGKRLLIDPGSPSPGYPSDYWGKDQWKYYNRSSFGHNIIEINGNELKHLPRDQHQGKLLAQGQTDSTAYWYFDLSSAYGPTEKVFRIITHYMPNLLVVKDSVIVTDIKDTVSLRWHGVEILKESDQQAQFSNGDISLSALFFSTNTIDLSYKEHSYKAPYNRYRLGSLLTQKHEPYMELICTGERTHVINSIFYLNPPGKYSTWEKNGAFYEINKTKILNQ